MDIFRHDCDVWNKLRFADIFPLHRTHYACPPAIIISAVRATVSAVARSAVYIATTEGFLRAVLILRDRASMQRECTRSEVGVQTVQMFLSKVALRHTGCLGCFSRARREASICRAMQFYIVSKNRIVSRRVNAMYIRTRSNPYVSRIRSIAHMIDEMCLN